MASPHIHRPEIHLGPTQPPHLVDAIERAGATVVDSPKADAIVWTGSPDQFPATVPDSVRWVQLPSAGVESWFASGTLVGGGSRVWTSAAGAYSSSVAEHALGLLIAATRHFPAQFAAESWDQAGFGAISRSLRGATVAIVGCGGIGRALIPMLTSVGADTLAVTRSGKPVDGAIETVGADNLAEVWPRADHIVLGAPATSDTRYLVGRPELEAMKSDAWLINIARGSLIDTEALVAALRDGEIAGAALDVTEPEPLPDGHPLWTLPNAIITPHVANPPSSLTPAFAFHVGENVRRFVAGDELNAVIDLDAGY
ncbi:D-isomer specific 2-hydroxyacid dehydrogenase family protein [Rhodococcoides yunnanense]|uniref:D-isomer specific 2-hydroxyacid dehydrogenase family protein n=1 Tax=Rhodococcoides yunnanense TaxID=278209 RepID=UPI000933C95A|nr:D-isomer specific 2-hydroxyacid dehydrogenase family protein [Rhodococcus yunnanensis]